MQSVSIPERVLEALKQQCSNRCLQKRVSIPERVLEALKHAHHVLIDASTSGFNP